MRRGFTIIEFIVLLVLIAAIAAALRGCTASLLDSSNTTETKKVVNKNPLERKIETSTKMLRKQISFLNNSLKDHMVWICRIAKPIVDPLGYYSIQIRKDGCSYPEHFIINADSSIAQIEKIAKKYHFNTFKNYKKELEKIKQYRKLINKYEDYIFQLESTRTRYMAAQAMKNSNIAKIEKDSLKVLKNINKEMTYSNIQ